MMKKLLPIFVGLLMCLCPLSVFAASGTIRVQLPQNMSGGVVTYSKEGGEKQTVIVDENGNAKIENLEEGIYQIDIEETSDYVFTSALVSIPMWSEEEHRMLYDVTVIPKYIRKIEVDKTENVEAPSTGDKTKNNTYLILGLISLIILVIMSCHNRFNCDTMTDKYSKNGGYSNGNDNDTKNPRRTRRIRISSPGTID